MTTTDPTTDLLEQADAILIAEAEELLNALDLGALCHV